MASNREERFRTRQRGAGTHKVGEVDFALAFPSVENVRPGQQASPGTRPQPTPRDLRTVPLPTLAGRRTPRLPSAKRGRLSERGDTGPNKLAYVSTLASAGEISPTKRRKLNVTESPLNDEQPLLLAQASSPSRLRLPDSAPSTKSGPLRPRDHNVSINVSSLAARQSADELTGEEHFDDESEAGHVGEGTELAEASVGMPTTSGMHDDQKDNYDESRGATGEQEGPSMMDDLRLESGNGPAQTPTPIRRRSQRLSAPGSGHRSTQKDGEGVSAFKPINAALLSRFVRPSGIGPYHSEEEMESDGEDDLQSPSVRANQRRKHRESVQSDGEDILQSPSVHDVAPRQAPTPVPSIRPPALVPHRRVVSSQVEPVVRRKRGRPRKEQAVQRRTMTTTKRSSKPIPVQVHRHHLSRPVAGDADEAEQGVADSMSNFIRPSGVNAVDVLSQICREYIDAAVEAIHRQGREAKSEGQKSEIRRKRRAVEAFGQELHERCFDMTEALDNNYALTVRVRRANREKIALRDELLRIRGERQSVALEMDEVQRNVEGKFLVAKEQDELNNSIHDVELALHRGRTLAQQQGEDDDEHDDESDMAYLELRIQDVAQAASSRGQGPGLLQDVQAFNAFLERTAAVLEGQG